MREKVNLRCYKCNHEFIKELETQDKVYEQICPKCNKQTVEIDLGKKTITLNSFRRDR